MPLEKITNTNDSIWGFWNITEDEKFFVEEFNVTGQIPTALTHETKRLEFASVRALLKSLLAAWKLQYNGIVKDDFGKPYLAGHSLHISLSHSFPYVAAVIHRSTSVGIDLEQRKSKLLRIAPRILNERELADAGDDITKHCIYWCAKEALVKIHGKKDLTFAENLLVDPFNLANDGHINGRILANTIDETIALRYHVYDNFVVVLNA
ncbi:MAG TPA: 4'-phosphopantetheinyl transferase superfamily protein [Chryseosolibacter sp.]|nr:4'-phosphopantetheinyl transferase superfamily protein [Chryseosolibacter sp.]